MISLNPNLMAAVDLINDANDIVLTRGTDVEMYFGVTKPDDLPKHAGSSEIASTINKNAEINICNRATARNSTIRSIYSDKKNLSDTMLDNIVPANKTLGKPSCFRSESQLKRIRTPAKAIHIPVARNESVSASMDIIHLRSEMIKEINVVEKEHCIVNLQNQKAIINSNNEDTTAIVQTIEKSSEEKATTLTGFSITLDSNQRSQVPKCWDSHKNYIKSHSKFKEKIPVERLFKKAYTPIVDVNSQYNFIAQGENSKLAWVHRMISSDFKDISEPIEYENSCYFQKTPHKEVKRNSHFEKQPLALGNAHFECSDIRISKTEPKVIKKNDFLMDKSSNKLLNNGEKKVSFWNLGNDLRPQNFLVGSQLNSKIVRNKISDLNPLSFKEEAKIRSVLKTATVDLQTRKSESSTQLIKGANLICVETSGWDYSHSLDLKFQDFKERKSELIFDPSEKINHKLDMIPVSIPPQNCKPYIVDETALIALGHDIFKYSPKKIEKPISFSDGIEMIQFIVELNRRISAFQRIIKCKLSSTKAQKMRPTQPPSESWKAFAQATELLRSKFPNQFMELEISSTRIPLKSQFEKILKII